MKKIGLVLTQCILTCLAYAQLGNGGFETYATLPTCPINSSSNTSITHCSTWSGLKSSYPSNCTHTDVSGSSSGVQYFNSTLGGTASCQPISAHSGNAYAYAEFQGFYPSSTGYSEYMYQTLSSSLTGGTTYLLSVYLNTISTGSEINAWLVSTSVGSSASAILNDVRSQNNGNGFYETDSNWHLENFLLTPPSSGNYYLVIGEYSGCYDGNASYLFKWALDDVTFGVAPNCTADAGPNKTNLTACCGTTPCTGVTIGTTAVSGLNYSWAPTTNLSCTYCAQPTAAPCNTVTPTVYTVTVSGSDCATTTSTVQVTTNKYTGISCCRIGHFSKEEISTFSVYPSPAKEHIIITLYDKPEYLRIMDVNGKMLFEQKDIVESEYKVDISGYQRGIYFAVAKIGDKIEKEKFVVE